MIVQGYIYPFSVKTIAGKTMLIRNTFNIVPKTNSTIPSEMRPERNTRIGKGQKYEYCSMEISFAHGQ